MQVEAQEAVMDRMKEVFRMHGASPMASCQLGFPPADFPADAVTLLAPCGAPWGLRYDLRYPFAAWLAHQAALYGTSRLPTHSLACDLWFACVYHADAMRLLSCGAVNFSPLLPLYVAASLPPTHVLITSCCTTQSLLSHLTSSGLCARTSTILCSLAYLLCHPHPVTAPLPVLCRFCMQHMCTLCHTCFVQPACFKTHKLCCACCIPSLPQELACDFSLHHVWQVQST